MVCAKVIAEIGCVHGGSMERAKELIKLAKFCNADVAKFQKRNPKESTPESLWDKPHENARFAFGKTYLEHRINLELSQAQHAQLKQFCEDLGIIYATSVWDLTSAKEIIELKPQLIKIPSACNMNWALLDYIGKNYTGEIHISLGMTSREERKMIRDYMVPFLDRVIAYHCTSGYPVPFEQLYLKDIADLKHSYEKVGFSNHGYGIASDIAAYTLGAEYIERHFVDDRTYPHTDAAASLEPDGLRRLTRDLKAVHAAMGKKPDWLTEIERVQRAKLRP